MKKGFYYFYYRLAKFYKNVFGIDDSELFFVFSCYSWGMLVLLASLYFYLLSIETMTLWWIGIRTNATIIFLTMLPFAFIHIYLERREKSLQKKFKELESEYRNEKLSWLKGLLLFLFVILSLVCFIMTIKLCK